MPIALETFDGNWADALAEVERTQMPQLLTLHGQPCGALMTATAAARLAWETAPHAAVPVVETPSPTYLDLLIADPTLLPHYEGRALRFTTMMNTSFVDDQQLYQFDDLHTRLTHIFRADELKQALGRDFVPVDFIPVHPAEYVERERARRQS